MPSGPTFIFVNKSGSSKSLSRSSGSEKSRIFSHVQRTFPNRSHLSHSETKSPEKLLQSDCSNEDGDMPRDDIQESGRHIQSDIQMPHARYLVDNSTGRDPCVSDHQKRRSESARVDQVHLHINRSHKPYANPASSELHNRAMYNEQVVGLFVESQTSVIRRQDDSNDLTPFMWTVTLPYLRGKSQTIDVSLLALSSAALGRRHHDQALTDIAPVAYGRALSSLQRDISVAVTTADDNILCACLLLISYQLYNGRSDRRDWVAHTNGLSQIIALRQPSSFCTGLAHKVFLIARSKIVLSALAQGKSTFLAAECWRKEPWRLHSKSDYEMMVDCMTQLPGLLERYTKINRTMGRSERRIKRLDFIHRSCAVEAEFIHWFHGLPSHVKDIAVVPTKSRGRLRFDHSTNPFPKSYQFSSLKSASMMMKYWACLADIHLLLHDTLKALTESDTNHDEICPSEKLFARNTDSSAYCTNTSRNECSTCCPASAFSIHSYRPTWLKDTEDPETLAKAFAMHICMSVQYCLQDDICSTGRDYVQFPMKAAVRVFRANLPEMVREMEWCNKVFAMLADI